MWFTRFEEILRRCVIVIVRNVHVPWVSETWKDYDRYVREAFDIGEDRTYKHRNCTIGFIHLWVLFLFLVVLYFRMLDDVRKPESLFWRPCSISLWSPWLSLLSTDFLAQFSHDKMSCRHSTCTWLNMKKHPAIRHYYQVDQNYHVSHLFKVMASMYNTYVCTCFMASLQAFDHLLLFGELVFVTSLSVQH